MNSELGLKIERFSENQSQAWDDFVFNEAHNGSFVQSRNFLNYHPRERFIDHSLIISRPGNIVAVIPACEMNSDGGKILSSHKGSSFGGLIVRRDYFNTTYLSAIIELTENYARAKGFAGIELKQFPGIFSHGSVDNLDYLLLINGYIKDHDLTFVVDTRKFKADDILSEFRLNVSQQIKQGLDYGLRVRRLADAAAVEKWHGLLAENLKKHAVAPVHTAAELWDLAKRFPEEINFWGCFKGADMIGGAMTWQYNDRVLHLQNIAIDYAYQQLRPGNVLNHHLIAAARAKNIPYFSFGSSTEDNGRRLNFGLARFKEGFGADGYLKHNFSKQL